MKITEPLVRQRVRVEEIDDLLLLTHDERPKVRSRAVQALCPCHVRADVERVWERLFEMVSDEDARVRSTILHALGDGSPRVLETRVVRALERMQHDPDPRLRRRVRKLLAHYRRTGQINIL